MLTTKNVITELSAIASAYKISNNELMISLLRLENKLNEIDYSKKDYEFYNQYSKKFSLADLPDVIKHLARHMSK